MTDTIHLGYEVGTGNAVAIPLRNLAVTGQTQESGKTTTLEALVARAGVSALAFVTKRGESSFVEGRRIQPYFRDRADWQFVVSIIDATLAEKNKFLRPWIMKICRSTRTLAEVQDRVRDALKTAKGINEGVYTQLDAYLDLIVPEIRRTPLAPTLDLRPGLNVMDVSASPTPMQMLFVQSALDWVNDRSEHTVVVVPEAWEFIPEGKGSPVKESAVTLVRKGSGIGNRIWVDSQDMAGVDKVVLRGCPVWLIGVQREANEIKRNLSNIPKSIKRPTAAMVATLERGQFYACWGTHAIKTYVQPAWMTDVEACAHAMGAPVPPELRAKAPRPVALPITEEPTVNEREAQDLRDENETLRSQISSLETRLNAVRMADEAERKRAKNAPSSNDKGPESAPVSGRHPGLSSTDGNAGSTPVGAAPRSFSPGETVATEATYQAFKARLISELPSDPMVMRIVTMRPELMVEVERKIVTVDESSVKGRVAKLYARGYFDSPRGQSETRTELRRTGTDVNVNTLAGAFGDLLVAGFFVKDGSKYAAVAGMKVNVVER